MSADDTLVSDPIGAAPAARDQRTLSIALGVLAGIVVLGLVWFFLLSGDDEVPATDGSTPAAEAVDDTTLDPLETSDDGSDLGALPVVTYDVYLARDPFEPVVEPDVPDGTPDQPGPSDPGAVPPGTDPTAPTDPTDPTQPGTPPPGTTPPGSFPPGTPGQPGPGTGPGTTPPPSGSPGTCVGSRDELVCDGRVVTLRSVVTRDGQRVAVVQVDTTTYEVAQGEIFGTNFRILEFTSTSQVLLQYGEFTYELRLGGSLK